MSSIGKLNEIDALVLEASSPGQRERKQLKTFCERIQTVLNYKPGHYRYLDINSSGQLCFKTFRSKSSQGLENLFRVYADQAAELYSNCTSSRKEEGVLMIANLILGYKHIEQDYPEKTYPSIAKGASAARKSLEDSYEEIAKFSLYRQQGFIKLKKGEHPASLLDSPILGLLASQVKELFKDYYGKWLTDKIFKNYGDECRGALNAAQIKLLVIAAAAEVDITSLMELHKKRGGTEESFFNLDINSLKELFNHFRRGPNELDLLEFCNIPTSSDGGLIDEDLLKRLSAYPKFCSMLNNFGRLCSFKFWNPSKYTGLSKDHIVDEIAKLPVENLHNYKVFYKYLSATVALLELDPLERDLSFKKLATYMQNNCKNVPHGSLSKDYQILGGYLHAVINNIPLDPSELVSTYCFKKDKNLQARTAELKMSEFFARKIGYLHWDYGTDSTPSKLLNDTLCEVYEDNQTVLYHIYHVRGNGGLVFQILFPIDPWRYVSQWKPVPIVAVFQGTIKSRHSIIRDVRENPGKNEWTEPNEKLFVNTLQRAQSKVQEHCPEAKFKITITGHSLGGCDTQYASTALARSLLNKQKLCKEIVSVQPVTFNSPGIEAVEIDVYNKASEQLNGQVDLRTPIHSLIRLDLVQTWGDKKSGIMILSESHSTGSKGNPINILTRHSEYAFSGLRMRRHVTMDSEKCLYFVGALATSTGLINKLFKLVWEYNSTVLKM